MKKPTVSDLFTNAVLSAALALLVFSTWNGMAQPDPRRIEEGIWKAVVRIESVVNTNGDSKVGTGFLVSKAIVKNGQTNRVSFLVTNKHMVGDWNAADGDISKFYENLRVFCYSRTEPVALTNVAELVKRKFALLHANPKVDVALISLLDDRSRLKGLTFDVSRILKFTETDPVGLGDQVFALGYPHGIMSLDNNYPVAKAGYLSSLPGEPFRTRQIVVNRKGENIPTDIQGKIYLVDGLLVLGNSGGPVLTPSEVRIRADFAIRQTQNNVIGIMSMTLSGAGLSIVYSSDYVIDLIDEFDRSVKGINGNVLAFEP